MTAAPSAFARIMTWAAVVLTLVLLALGVVWYGFSADVHQRFWQDIADRIHGPMTFRFILQPVMAFVAALPDGVNDARLGRSAFFWTGRGDPAVKHGRLRQGLESTARVVLLGISMDVIYQMRVSDQFFPAEAVVMAILLAVVPYFIFRPIIERVARWWFAGARHRSQ